ncbi:MAG: hypothetical protein AB7F67_03790 [Rhodospirillaceae bacterium]
MATYTELFALRDHPELTNRITVAATIAAVAIVAESDQTANHANRLIWARTTLKDPSAMARRLLWTLLAQNATLTPAQLVAVTDANLLAAVNGVINVFADDLAAIGGTP